MIEVDIVDDIDPIANLADRAVYVVTSDDDEEFYPEYQDATDLVFFDLNADTDNLNLVFDDGTGSDFNDYDSTDALTWIFDNRNYIDEDDFLDWQDSSVDYNDEGSYITFDQTEFATDADFTTGDLADKEEGRAYIPTTCETTTCRVHVVFHEAGVSPTVLAEDKGYNLLGALNDIIMLYPATVAWDMQGTNGKTKNGEVIKMVKAMIDRLTG